MNQGDLQYNGIIKKILEHGKWDKDVRARWDDGSPAPTKSILNTSMTFDNGVEIPLITSKRVAIKSALVEMFWIWLKKSNVVQHLRDMGATIWDEWEKPDGTIGKAYGWQLANKRRKVKIDDLFFQMWRDGELSRFIPVFEDGGDKAFTHGMLDQVDYLLYTLKKNPNSRRIKTTLWCVEDLDDMALEPCVYETHWQLWDGKLHLTVNIRSNDMALGNPFNIYQYAILHRMIAQVTGHKVGTIHFNIDNAHIYDRHLEALEGQLNMPTFEVPEIWINPEVTSFYEFTVDDVKVIDYKHGKSIKMEVAI